MSGSDFDFAALFNVPDSPTDLEVNEVVAKFAWSSARSEASVVNTEVVDRRIAAVCREEGHPIKQLARNKAGTANAISSFGFAKREVLNDKGEKVLEWYAAISPYSLAAQGQRGVTAGAATDKLIRLLELKYAIKSEWMPGSDRTQLDDIRHTICVNFYVVISDCGDDDVEYAHAGELQVGGDLMFLFAFLGIKPRFFGYKLEGRRWVLSTKAMKDNSTNYKGSTRAAMNALEQAILNANDKAPYVWKYFQLNLHAREQEAEVEVNPPLKGRDRASKRGRDD